MNLPPADLQRLLAEEPFVRRLAHSLLADEADDVVQDAWVRAIEAKPAEVRDTRSWLARIVQHLAIDSRRRRVRRRAREAAMPAATLVPSSAELAIAEERRRALVAAVDALPEHLRTVVLLRWFAGMPPRRIASELGVPAPVVWNRLHAALTALRARLDAEHGGERRAWLVPLVPFAVAPRELPWRELMGPAAAMPLATGVIAMTTKTKMLCAAGVVAAFALAWTLWQPEPPGPLPPTPSPSPAAAVVASLEQPQADAAPSAQLREAVRDAKASDPTTTGTIEVVVKYADAPTAAGDVLVLAVPSSGDYRTDALRRFTDGDGRARFVGLTPGEYVVRAHGRNGPGARLAVEASQVAMRELLLRGGYRLDGVVVDAVGAPVGGATIENAQGATTGTGAHAVATTAADGTFVLRHCPPASLFGARAPGFAASKLHYVRGSLGGASLRIELREIGGSVDGIVVDPDGRPIAGAVVRVGSGQCEELRSTAQGAPPLPAQAISAADGSFATCGVPVGTQPVMVRVPTMAPWLGSVEVTAGGTAAVHVAMARGVTCRGIVRDERSAPCKGATVSVGKRGEFMRFEVVTGADGAFVLRGLPAGDIDIAAELHQVGKAAQRVRGEPGTEVPCDLVLTPGIVLQGRVVDEAGAPLPRVDVRAEAEGRGAYWLGNAFSGADGGFRITDCPPGRTLVVTAGQRDRVSWRRAGVEPRTGDHEIVLPKDTAPRARIVGLLLTPDGNGAVGCAVEAHRNRPQEFAEAAIREASGSFAIEVGPGSWMIRIMAKGHPEIRREARELAPGDVWDLGTLQLAIGGTLVVHEPETKANYLVVDAEERFVCGLYSPTLPHRSDLIAPGDYRLLVSGKGIAATAIPFAITAERDTELTVKPAPGVAVQFQFVLPANDASRSVSYSLQQHGRLVAFGSTSSSASLLGESFLAAGDYELVTRDRPRSTTFAFTVREATATPIVVTLQ
jgi:RNA polymerase sigma factor (sigma-70 family)